MKNLKELQETLRNFNGKDLYIRFEGSLRTYLHIYNAQCMITNTVLLIGNSDFEDSQELELLVDDINEIEITSQNEVMLYMNGNYNINITI